MTSDPAAAVLVLGGTAEGRALAAGLVSEGVPVLSSLGGRVAEPRRPTGEVRIGGFGGVSGLRAWLRSHRTPAVVDATHPFAAQISAHAAEACDLEGVALLRLARPGWSEEVGASAWTWVGDHAAAARAVVDLGGVRPFLTVGRQSLRAFLGPLAATAALVRVVDPPSLSVPTGWEVVRSRGPWMVSAERETFLDHDVDVLVTKDSGGPFTRAKLAAAAGLGVPVVVVRRPAPPVGVPTVSTVEAALAWVRERHLS